MQPFKKISLFLALVALIAIFPVSVFAQAAQIGLLVEQVDITAFPKVTLQVSTWDESGLPLVGLKPEDFTLQESGSPAVHPESVQVDNQSPVRVVLAIDVSSSMAGQPLTDARAAAARFLDRLSASDQAGLIAFSDAVDKDSAKLDPERELALSSNLTVFYDKVEGLRASGGTHLYDAAARAVRLAADAPFGHRAVLLLSDGRNDPPNQGDPEEAMRLAREARIPVFVIGLGGQVDEPYLRRLASETGGLFRSAPRSSELAQLFGDMAVLLKTQYSLTYHSLITNGSQAELNINLKFKGATVENRLPLGKLPALSPAPTHEAAVTAATPTPVKEVKALAAAQVETAAPAPSSPWGWLLAAVLATAAGVWFSLSRRKPRPAPEVCAKCGFDRTGKTGACPECGETRRLAKK